MHSVSPPPAHIDRNPFQATLQVILDKSCFAHFDAAKCFDDFVALLGEAPKLIFNKDVEADLNTRLLAKGEPAKAAVGGFRLDKWTKAPSVASFLEKFPCVRMCSLGIYCRLCRVFDVKLHGNESGV